MIFVQNWPFFHLLFLGNIRQENVFYDIVERKNAFLGYKNSMFKKWKNVIFAKGLTHGFCPKLAIFPCFILRQNRPGKCVLCYSRMKKRLFRLEKQEVQKVEILRFFQRGLTHGFGPKLAIFPCFFFSPNRPGKCVLRYSRMKKRLFRL